MPPGSRLTSRSSAALDWTRRETALSSIVAIAAAAIFSVRYPAYVRRRIANSGAPSPAMSRP